MHLDHTEKQTSENDTNESKKASKWPKVSYLTKKMLLTSTHTSPREMAALYMTTHTWKGKELTKLGEATSNSEHKV
jgi:hypothetical protein